MVRRYKKEPGELRSVNELLSAYKQRLRPPQKVVVEEVVEVISDLFSVKIPAERVSYKPAEKRLYLNVSGALKSEVLLRKNEILTHVRARLGVRESPTDIR